jgi:YVTN family beta-propeller protein
MNSIFRRFSGRLCLFCTACLLASVSASAPIAQSGRLVIANQYEHTLLVVDPSEHRVIFRVGVDINGHEVAVSPDHRFAFVPIYGDSGVGRPGTDGRTIQVVDLYGGFTGSVINLGKSVRPHSAKFAPGGLLYVTAELANAVFAVDPETRKVLAEIPTGQTESHMLVISPDGSRAYTANVNAGSISVLDLRNRTLVTTIPVASHVQRLSLSPDGRRLFTHDQDRPRIAVIDTASNSISSWIALPQTVYSSAPTPDGRSLIANSPAGKLFVVDLASGTVAHTFDIPGALGEIAMDAGGDHAYISCPQAGTVEVLNLAKSALESPIQLTKGVDGIEWFSAAKEIEGVTSLLR